MQALSKAILERLTASSPPPSSVNSPNGRSIGIPRSAPISSSRDDPLPNPNESFPAPLPAVTLPYELSLLDNLFINPMSSHKKASEYTNGNKSRCAQKSATEHRHGASSAGPATLSASLSGHSWERERGFPPSAFGGTGTTSNGAEADPSLSGVQAYGMAAQVGAAADGGSGAAYPSLADNIKANMSAAGANSGTANQTMGVGAGPADTGFDLLSFLMDEEGGLGTGTWDSLDVPADYSLWS